MARPKQQKPEFVTCEICGQACDADERCGCEKCGRMYGPCCNSLEDSICVECV
ncbi:MAG TPA: hypothetical protein VFA33_06170 [Bryobacteraceae bacterium]|nr:hypothetical protein [Bryobacteraceae bacterium]